MSRGLFWSWCGFFATVILRRSCFGSTLFEINADTIVHKLVFFFDVVEQ